jgi:hypothetical protein
LGDERRVRARDPRRPRAMEVTTSCVPSAVPAADLRFGGVVGPSWFLRAAGDFPHDASEAHFSFEGNAITFLISRTAPRPEDFVLVPQRAF